MSETAARRLSDEQIAEIYREDVRPTLARFSSQDSPRMLALGGPQGSRKSTLRSAVAEQLELGDVVYFDGDDHYTFHPHYDALALEHGALEAARLCRPDVEILRAHILGEAFARRLNVMLVGPLTNEEYTFRQVDLFRDNGYRTELAYTALHPALSQVGVMDRHRRAMTEGPGYSFLASVALQQQVLDDVPKILAVAEERGVVDALHVVDMSGVVFSKTRNGDGTWTPSRPAGDVVEETRKQSWSPATVQGFRERRAAVSAPVGESPEVWNARLVRIDELAAPMLIPPAPGGRPSAAAARKRSTTLPASRAGKKAAAPPPTARPARPSPGRESSSGRSR